MDRRASCEGLAAVALLAGLFVWRRKRKTTKKEGGLKEETGSTEAELDAQPAVVP